MVTGDNPRTALAIARQIGLVRGDAPAVITGPNCAACTRPSCNWR
jgi:sodium/potassium-transporting ATPase subunit alpha